MTFSSHDLKIIGSKLNSYVSSKHNGIEAALNAKPLTLTNTEKTVMQQWKWIERRV